MTLSGVLLRGRCWLAIAAVALIPCAAAADEQKSGSGDGAQSETSAESQQRSNQDQDPDTALAERVLQTLSESRKEQMRSERSGAPRADRRSGARGKGASPRPQRSRAGQPSRDASPSIPNDRRGAGFSDVQTDLESERADQAHSADAAGHDQGAQNAAGERQRTGPPTTMSTEPADAQGDNADTETDTAGESAPASANSPADTDSGSQASGEERAATSSGLFSADGADAEAAADAEANRPASNASNTGPTARTYTIQQGETFTSIAKKVYGSRKHWTAIAKANPLVDPTKLKVGQQIKLPPNLQQHRDQRRQQLDRVREAVSGPSGETRTVTVEPGDTLSHIAERVYGEAALWPRILEANEQKLPSPDELKPGMELKIPARAEGHAE